MINREQFLAQIGASSRLRSSFLVFLGEELLEDRARTGCNEVVLLALVADEVAKSVVLAFAEEEAFARRVGDALVADQLGL